ncbi:sporulation transcription factor Spo0A [Petroclostridium sp. X23]|uniref:sporulation transcription factor Spo0A n=1 Tax=Petroclostridium sp. X23 TaxID=3045146 RepID=UPI0024ACF6D5|nr:sporulation transcription factor Spo0A [Petroclostridium sp. X23]WHH59193.1 sporulation transcription factor Spo0A [Petroclostridium sp. X23]
MNKIRIVVADDNIDFADMLAEYLNSQPEFEVIGIANDGNEAYDLIKELIPDVAIIDVVMPHIDGLGVLEKLMFTNIHPKPIYIMLSSIGHDSTTQKSFILGADYYMAKPIDVSIVAKRIKLLFNSISKYSKSDNTGNNHDNEVIISEYIHDLGITLYPKGYLYVRDAIDMTIRDMNIIDSITKNVYPELAKRYKTMPSSVERSIRKAISEAWENGNAKMINLFKYKPSNSEFVAKVADELRYILYKK